MGANSRTPWLSLLTVLSSCIQLARPQIPAAWTKAPADEFDRHEDSETPPTAEEAPKTEDLTSTPAPFPTPIATPVVAPAVAAPTVAAPAVANNSVLTKYAVQFMDIAFSGFNTYGAFVMPYADGVRMWYHGQQQKPRGRAKAKDQIYTRFGYVGDTISSWTSYAVNIGPENVPGANAEHVGDPVVSVIKDPVTNVSTFILFLTVCVNGCTNINNDGQIWSAYSLDGVHWGDFRPVIGGVANPGGPAGPYAAEPYVVLDSSLSPDQRWMLYYPDPNTYSINAIPVDKNRNVMRNVGGKIFPKAVYKDATYVSAVEVHQFGDRYYLTATRNSVKAGYVGGSAMYPYTHFDMIVAESNDPLNFGTNTANPLLSFAADPVNCGALTPTIHKLNETQFDIYFTLLSRRGGDCLLYDDRVAQRPMLRWRFGVSRIQQP